MADGYGDESRKPALLELARALALIASRLRTRATVSSDLEQLTVLAAHIAAKAWEVRTSKWELAANAEKLATDLLTFAEVTAATSKKAAAETQRNKAIVDALSGQAERIVALAGRQGADPPQGMRTELRPLAAILPTLQVCIAAENAIVGDVAHLSEMAGDLAALARSLRGRGHDAKQVAEAIGRLLANFIRVATDIAARMANTAGGLGEAAARLAADAARAGQPSSTPPDEHDPPSGRQWS